MASTQVIVSGATLFILYYYLLRTIGATELGIWSVVLATSSTARLSELGLSGGVVRFVAKYMARRDEASSGAVVQTAAISIAGLMIVVVVALYPVLGSVLRYFLPADGYSAGLRLIPFALISLWFGSLSGVFTSALDGILRTDVRSLVMMGGVALHLVLVFIFVPKYGLLGLAYAQVIQSIFVLVLSWSILRRYLTLLPIFPSRWNRSLFVEMFRYGVNFQIGSMAQLFCEPATKLLMSKFGGLDLVAYYEMANRMVTQLRALVVSASQVMVPVISGIFEAAPERLASVYREYYSLLMFVALPLFSGLVAITPIVSEIWVGDYEKSFVIFSTILAIGWFLNTFNAPSYFSNMGTGHLNWNTTAHVVIAILNVILGAGLGSMFGGFGVALGFSVALAIGSALVIVSYHVKNNISFSELMRQEHRKLALASLIVPFCTWKFHQYADGEWGIAIVAFVSVIFVTGTFSSLLWAHPARGNIMRRVFPKV